MAKYDVPKLVKSGILEQDIACPTLFIWGTKDGVISESVIDRQARFIKGSFTSIALETGHNLIQTKETEVIQAILEHLKDDQGPAWTARGF